MSPAAMRPPDPSWRCPAHEDLVREVVSTRTTAEATLEAVKRIEARQHEDVQTIATNTGAHRATERVVTVVVAGLALVVAGLTFVAQVWR